MKKRISVEELSAFLDGEAKHPEEVLWLLQESEEVARKHAALSKVSAQVRSLPEPYVRPGFSGRVIASLQDSESHRSLPWQIPAGASLMAVILAVFAVVGLNDSVTPPAVQTAASAPAQITPETIALEVEDALVAELERRIASDRTSTAVLSDGCYKEPEPVEGLPTDLLLALAPAGWLDSFGGLNEGSDYTTEMGALSDTEKRIFVQLLEEYARTETQGVAAREG